MKVESLILYKGYHSKEAQKVVSSSWSGNHLVIFCPPTLNNFEFLRFFPHAKVQQAGELWESQPLPSIEKTKSVDWKEPPVFGVFTSGTTRVPKLVLYSKKNITSCSESIFSLFETRRIHTVFCYPQPFHTFGLTLGYVSSKLHHWNLIVPQGRYQTHHHQEWLSQVNRGTLTLGTPTHLIDLLSWVKSQKKHPPSSYSAIIGGAKVPRNLWCQLQDVLNIEAPSIGYGATEASPGLTHLPPGQPPLQDGEVGYPLSHLEILVDPEKGVRFSGPSLCTAMIENDKIELPQSFTVPDRIEVSEEGLWTYKGRLQWMLNRGGSKLSLETAEQFLKSQMNIHSLCVALPDSRLGEELGLLVESPKDYKINPEKVFTLLRSHFAMNFSDKYFLEVSRLPRNANLKYDRAQAKEWILENVKNCVDV